MTHSLYLPYMVHNVAQSRDVVLSTTPQIYELDLSVTTEINKRYEACFIYEYVKYTKSFPVEQLIV